MGCCIGLKSDSFTEKDVIINLSYSRGDFIVSSYKISLNKEENLIKADKIKYRKASSKTAETSHDENIIPIQNKEKIVNTHPKRIKDIAKNLRTINKNEIKDIRKFFSLK